MWHKIHIQLCTHSPSESHLYFGQRMINRQIISVDDCCVFSIFSFFTGFAFKFKFNFNVNFTHCAGEKYSTTIFNLCKMVSPWMVIIIAFFPVCAPECEVAYQFHYELITAQRVYVCSCKRLAWWKPITKLIATKRNHVHVLTCISN